MPKSNSLIIRDAKSGETLCSRSKLWGDGAHNPVLEVPVKVVECRAVSREITFHSKKEISNFSVIQRVMIQQRISADKRARPKWICLEEWVFHFGFVIPGSTNTWQSVVESATDEQGNTIASSRDMRGAEFTIETSFYDDKVFICKNSVQVQYI